MKYIFEIVDTTPPIAMTTTDPKILTNFLRRGKDDAASWFAASNKNCPPEILKEVLEGGKDDTVSECAIGNPNCPIEDKINWMIKVGKIEKEDPKKHIIEYENVKEDDLQDLKDLL